MGIDKYPERLLGEIDKKRNNFQYNKATNYCITQDEVDERQHQCKNSHDNPCVDYCFTINDQEWIIFISKQ